VDYLGALARAVQADPASVDAAMREFL
jgi:hypothetical protein